MLAEDIKAKFKSRMLMSPSVFLGFGSPMLAIDFDSFNESFTDFLGTVPYPRSILVITPFWQTDGVVKVTGNKYPELIYDFEGGPDTLRLLTYPCMGNPDLADSAVKLLNDMDIAAEVDEDRGFDKGTWVPLYVAFPDMDVSIVQMSMPMDATPETLYKMGIALSELRKTGTLILITGNTVHDQQSYDMLDKTKVSEVWAQNLDEWIAERINTGDVNSLYDISKNNLENLERLDKTRFNPLFVMMGTLQQKDFTTTLFDKFYYGNTSMRSFAFVPQE